jgi:hypothetical protein
LVEFGVRETGVGVEHWNKLESVEQANKAPEQHAVASVARERAVLVGTNEGIPEVAEELIEII